MSSDSRVARFLMLPCALLARHCVSNACVLQFRLRLHRIGYIRIRLGSDPLWYGSTRGFTKAFTNFAKYVIAFIFAKFKYFAKQIIYLESPDHVLQNDV